MTPLAQKFRQEMSRALIQTTIMFLIAVVILRSLTGRYPWQMGDQMGIEVEPGSSTAGADHGKLTNEDYEF